MNIHVYCTTQTIVTLEYTGNDFIRWTNVHVFRCYVLRFVCAASIVLSNVYTDRNIAIYVPYNEFSLCFRERTV